ncbi:MAG: histidine phosphatase family protein [Clostridium sp.]|nr:histidine phosphatase family protein [Clostridium sp.]
MKLYLIRHGQTDWNIEGKIQGKTDIPLNQTGLHQAKLLAKGMRSRQITEVYTSPLLRARQTAEILAEEKGLPVQEIPELREVDFGLWEGRTWEEIEAEYPEDFHRWEENPALGMPTGGETIDCCRERCRRAAEKILAGCCDVAVVAHGGILVHMVDYLLRNQKEKKEIIVKNASISVVEYDRYTAMGRLLILNDTAHLGTSDCNKTNKFC